MANIKILWSLLLDIYQEVQSNPTIERIAISRQDQSFSISKNSDTQALFTINLSGSETIIESGTIIQCLRPFHFQVHQNSCFDEESIGFLAKYLPYSVLPHFAYKMDKVFVISHFAQTLDGRIASESGDSKWIGNTENLTHAHRMRALSDAIGVGSGTLKIDKPSLNVRHVEGQNPIKVIIGKASEYLGNIDASKDRVLFVNNESLSISKSSQTKFCDTRKIIDYLKEHEIKTFYLEGGSATTSRFLKEGCVDQVQIHISPKILGSGKVGFSFDGIDTMNEVIEFKNYKFLSMGSQTMFVGEL